MRRRFGAATAVLLAMGSIIVGPRASVAGPVDFVKDVQPILKKHCFECHAGDREEGGLSLGSRPRALQGGAGGVVLVKGKSSDSPLMHRIMSTDKDQVMPPKGPRLSADEVRILRAWIDQGLDWPTSADQVDPRQQRAKDHWAFQPLRPTPIPKVNDPTWPTTPIDHFIRSKLEAVALRPSAPATPLHLCRRIYFDLIGLPPTPTEIDAFVAAAEKDSAAAVAALVDRLLASRQFGERWGRHWLDVARYADSNGMETDYDRPNAWRYRDFVIRSFNEDLPFDRFVRWQLAGDEYEPTNPAAIAATGFLAAGPTEKLDPKLLEEERLRERYNQLDDMMQTIGTGFLGLSLGCARCHDHKYDAIATREYYQMMSALHSGERTEVSLGTAKDKALGYRDFGPEPKPTWLFPRADFTNRSTTVELGFIATLSHGKSAPDYWTAAKQQGSRTDTTYQRRALAEWITDIDHGAGALLARVIVNRLWQHHFGQPLVATVSDFGVRSEPPTHPELLEYLAHDLVAQGWQLKRLHRLMLTSRVYQQASTTAATPAIDPDNRLLWRMRRRRLEAEAVRDAMLAVSDTLNDRPFGPAFKPPIAAEAMLARNVKDPYPKDIKDSPEVRRRSIYMFHKRVVPWPLFQAFDKPDAQQSCGRRDLTTIAPQALTLMNDPFVRTVAVEFADRLINESGDWMETAITRCYRLALGRDPSQSERAAALDFVTSQIQERTERSGDALLADSRRRALADLCQTIFCLNEFIMVD